MDHELQIMKLRIDGSWDELTDKPKGMHKIDVERKAVEEKRWKGAKRQTDRSD